MRAKPNTHLSGETVSNEQPRAESTQKTEPDASTLRVTVIVPFYGSTEELELCLLGLEKQTFPRDRTQVLIVDNASGKDLSALEERFPFATFLFEEKPSSYAARNRALRETLGDVVAFTDADCQPTPGWIVGGVETLLSNPEAGFVAGRIDMLFERDGDPTSIELFDLHFSVFDQAANARQNFSVTANLITWKRVLDDVGPFRDYLRSRGDWWWGKDAEEKGYTAVYGEAAAIGHPSRRRFSELSSKARRISGGHHDLAEERSWSLLRHFKAVVVFSTLEPIRDLRKVLRRGIDAPLSKRLGVYATIFAIHWIRASERVRLTLGGSSVR